MKSPNVKITNWDEANININQQNGIKGKDAYPSTLPIPFTATITEDIKTRLLTKDGVAYGSKVADGMPYKSSDFGETWTRLPASSSPGDVANQIWKLDSGKLLVITGTKHEGKAFLSDENEDNFTLKYEFNTSIGDVFGVDVYGDMILAAGYGGGVNYDKCFMSKDGGETWEVILQHPDPSISHFHDIRYDPYENIIWACSGDYGVKDNIFYSNDLGLTWETTYGIENLNVRATAIIPLPECVLFVSDTNGEMFVWRYDRHPQGTQGHQVIPYKAWYHKRGIPLDKSDFVGSKPAITYGANASAFFGWHCYTGGSYVAQANVFATRDGYTFTPIWTSQNLMNADYSNGVEGGILGVFGPTDKNELIATFVEGDGGVKPTVSAIKLGFTGWG